LEQASWFNGRREETVDSIQKTEGKRENRRKKKEERI
jgi:hypothetical protein